MKGSTETILAANNAFLSLVAVCGSLCIGRMSPQEGLMSQCEGDAIQSHYVIFAFASCATRHYYAALVWSCTNFVHTVRRACAHRPRCPLNPPPP